ncbi:unnamed protein product [Rhizopus stolonifer]
MTECIPNSYSSFPYKPKQHFRRSSITQATISSIAKDVRSKEDDVSSLLRKKRSEINLKSKRPTTRQSTKNPNVKARQDRPSEDDFLYMNNNKKYPRRHIYGSSDSLSSICSSSTSSSCNSKHFENNWPFAQPPPLSSKIPIYQLRETVLEDLASMANSYSHHLQDLTHLVSYSTHSIELPFQGPNPVTHKAHIDDCRALLVQQQQLLDKLQQLVQDNTAPEPVALPPPRLEKTTMQKMKDALVNPTGVTELVVRKNKKETIISVQGVCETIEASLVPYKLEKKNIYHFQYQLDISWLDRLDKFVLLSQKQWQKDDQVKSCQFKACCNQFGLLQRKHHCRRCGDIYCSSHSQNRLPLFTFENPEKTNFSRVCDSCFFDLAGNHLSLYT